MTTDPPIGSRVVLRYKLPPGYSHSMTDVIGELIARDPVTVRDELGHTVQVSADRVVALKVLGARVIRTKEIRALEFAAADGWPGLEQGWIDGWLLRCGAGFTGRANSATPLGQSASLEALPAITAWFAERGQSLRLLLPDRLGQAPAGWRVWDEVEVLAADIANVPLPEGSSMLHVDPRPSAHWLSLFRYRGTTPPPEAVQVLSAVRDGELGFGTIGAQMPTPLAIARAAITTAPDDRKWVGLTAVEVAQAHRRRGLGSLVCAELLRWARDHGATHAYLQVAADNKPAIAMYETLGFVAHHSYRYAEPHT